MKFLDEMYEIFAEGAMEFSSISHQESYVSLEQDKEVRFGIIDSKADNNNDGWLEEGWNCYNKFGVGRENIPTLWSKSVLHAWEVKGKNF